MAQYLPPQQHLTASAVPLASGKKHIYQTNTTTPLSLYSNEALSTPAANPIVADSAGVFAGVFLAATKCKFLITDSLDQTLYTYDPVYTIGASDSIAAEDVSFDGTTSGLSADNVQDAIDEVVGFALLASDIGVSVQAYDAQTAKLDDADQVVTGGARVTSLALNSGSAVTSGTLTPDPGDRPLQHYTNGGAHTLAPGSNPGSYILDITNNASAGAITTSGWTKVVNSSSLTTTNLHKFRCTCVIGDAGSLLIIQALQ